MTIKNALMTLSLAVHETALTRQKRENHCNSCLRSKEQRTQQRLLLTSKMILCGAHHRRLLLLRHQARLRLQRQQIQTLSWSR